MVRFFGSVLHPDFSYYHTQSRHFRTSSQSALISMGATDPKKLVKGTVSFLGSVAPILINAD
jgi:spore coat polysaccharide biosynthesis predicted glycosyltransferase SpsG